MEFDKEELKNETKETVNQVKDTMKNVDINKEATATKGFLADMLVDPFEKVRRIATGEEEDFKQAIVLILINIIAAALSALIYCFKSTYLGFFNKIGYLVIAVVSPLLAIVIPAVLILMMNKTDKKPLPVILSALTVARVPSIIGCVLGILSTLFYKISFVVSPVTSTLALLTTVFEFFAIKEIFGENKESFLTKFVIIEFITTFILYVI